MPTYLKFSVIGILEAPKFVGKSVISLSGVITYKLKQEENTGKYYFFVYLLPGILKLVFIRLFGKSGDGGKEHFKI
jgi:hypothetical protein